MQVRLTRVYDDPSPDEKGEDVAALILREVLEAL
jgi:hypothetical protein